MGGGKLQTEVCWGDKLQIRYDTFTTFLETFEMSYDTFKTHLVDLCEVECELLCVAGGSVDLPCTTPIRLPCKSTIWDIEVVLGVLGP